MKIVQINTTCGQGSTGKICQSVSELLEAENIENYILYTGGTSRYKYGIKYSDCLYVKIQAVISHIFGNYGFNSKAATERLISELENIKPDIVHIHNIHSHDCDIEKLAEYLKKNKIKVYWTFHDCWAFTGYCPYFDMVNCHKWKDGCHECTQKKSYSWFFDKSEELQQRKKKALDGLDLTIVAPSQWIADLVEDSFLRNTPIKVINNGINTDIFKPTKGLLGNNRISSGKNIVLGVALVWDNRKGIDVFKELAVKLGNEYQIVLVGTDSKVEKFLPKNIISINRTQNQQELAEIYTMADVFVNPTYEENYPTVNMEAIACGTPVVTFRTGGSPEMLDETCGSVVERGNVDALAKEIVRICTLHPFKEVDCLKKAEQYDVNKRFKEYIDMYKNDYE